MYPELLLANAHLAARRDAAARRRVRHEQRVSRPAAPNGVRVAVGQLLVRIGERLAGASPGHA